MTTVSFIGNTNAPPGLSLYLDSRDGNYPTSRSTYNPASERFTTSDDNYHTDVEFAMSNPLAFGHDVDTLVSCTSVAVPHSFYNVATGINDCLYFSTTIDGGAPQSFRAIVSPGNYTPAPLCRPLWRLRCRTTSPPQCQIFSGTSRRQGGLQRAASQTILQLRP
jgi:hypothetical protein